MKKIQLLIIFLTATLFIAGCSGAKTDNHSTTAGDFILHKDKINSIEIVEVSAKVEKASDLVGPGPLTLSNSFDISSLTSQLEEIPVKKLTTEEDIDFMKNRILADGFLEIGLNGEDKYLVSRQGMFFIWPDGVIYIVDIESMNSNLRTISYLSESKYPEIYKWLINKAKNL